MARLIVEACTAEWAPSLADVAYVLLVGVSVSRPDDGSPVTGLKGENFRVAAAFGFAYSFEISVDSEWNWEPADLEPTGCYELSIRMKHKGEATPEKFVEGLRYVFGIQVRTFKSRNPPIVVDQGQTIVEIVSTGV